MAVATVPVDVGDVFMELRPNLIRNARLQLLSRGLDEQLAEDLFQEAAARWFAKQPQYSGPGRLYAWMRTTMRYCAADMYRRHPDALDNLDRFYGWLDESASA